MVDLNPEELLRGNAGALALLAEVKSFYGTVTASWLPPESVTSSFSIDGFAGARIDGATVRIARGPRAAPALVHELLHLALRAWGFPLPATFDATGLLGLQTAVATSEFQAARNAVDHEALHRRYLELGYPASEFLSPSGYTTDLENLRWAMDRPEVDDLTRRMTFGGAYFRIRLSAGHGHEAASQVIETVTGLARRAISGFAGIEEAMSDWLDRGGLRRADTFQAAVTEIYGIVGLPAPQDWARLTR